MQAFQNRFQWIQFECPIEIVILNDDDDDDDDDVARDMKLYDYQTAKTIESV
jgi:hypothetical protein